MNFNLKRLLQTGALFYPAGIYQNKPETAALH